MIFQQQSQKFSNEKMINDLNASTIKLKQQLTDTTNAIQDKSKQYEKEIKSLQNEIIMLKNQEEIKRE